MPAARKRKKPAEVIAMPGAHRPEDVIKYIVQAMTSGKIKGIVVGMSFKDGRDVDVRICGSVKNGELVWIGALLQAEGLDGGKGT